MKRTFEKNLAALDAVFEFVDEFVRQHSVDPGAAFSVNFAIEEIFTNMVKYSVQNDHQVLISLDLVGKDFRIVFTEYEVDEFDITKVEPVDTGLPLEARKIGGLGLHLTREVMDKVEYAHRDGNSTITLTKNLEK